MKRLPSCCPVWKLISAKKLVDIAKAFPEGTTKQQTFRMLMRGMPHSSVLLSSSFPRLQLWQIFCATNHLGDIPGTAKDMEHT